MAQKGSKRNPVRGRLESQLGDYYRDVDDWASLPWSPVGAMARGIGNLFGAGRVAPPDLPVERDKEWGARHTRPMAALANLVGPSPRWDAESLSNLPADQLVELEGFLDQYFKSLQSPDNRVGVRPAGGREGSHPIFRQNPVPGPKVSNKDFEALIGAALNPRK